MNGNIQKTDSELARAAQAGEMAAFEELLSRYEKRLFSFLRQMTGNSHDAEDIAQNVWIAAHRNLHRYDPARTFSTWLFTIARNTAISEWRKRKTASLELQEHDWVDRGHPGEGAFARDEAATIWSFVRSNLGEEQRDALWLMYREDKSVGEIARTLKCSSVRVKVMLHRARKKLLKSLTDQPAPGVAGITEML